MVLYLLELDDRGFVVQLATVEGEIRDFENNPKFKAFLDLEEAEANMAKRFNGRTWEEVEREEAPNLEHHDPDQSIAILEGLASLSEEFNTFKETQKTITENQMAILEGLAGAFEAQGEEA